MVAADVPHGKPAPDIFIEAARRLGVDPARCRAYEDGESGLEAAYRAGMHTIDVTGMVGPATDLSESSDGPTCDDMFSGAGPTVGGVPRPAWPRASKGGASCFAGVAGASETVSACSFDRMGKKVKCRCVRCNQNKCDFATVIANGPLAGFTCCIQWAPHGGSSGSYSAVIGPSRGLTSPDRSREASRRIPGPPPRCIHRCLVFLARFLIREALGLQVRRQRRELAGRLIMATSAVRGRAQLRDRVGG